MSIPPDVRYLALLRQLVRGVAQLDAPPLSRRGVWRCSTALCEAVGNAVRHGQRRAEVAVELRLHRRALTMIVRDDGPRFTLAGTQPPDLRRTRGRGLFLIRHYCHTVRLTRARGKNVLTMVYDDART